MKKYIAILMILTILTGSIGTTAFAENGSASQSGDWLYTLSDGEATVTGYSGGAKAVCRAVRSAAVIPLPRSAERRFTAPPSRQSAFRLPSEKSAGGRFTAPVC